MYNNKITLMFLLIFSPLSLPAGYIDELPGANKVLKPISIDATDIVLKEIVNTDLVAPNQGVAIPGPNNAALMLVADQIGKVWVVDVDTGSKYVLLDIGTAGLNIIPSFSGRYTERGLLSIALHPNFLGNGLFYTFQSEGASLTTPTDFPLKFILSDNTVLIAPPAGQVTLREWHLSSNTSDLRASGTVDAISRLVIRINTTQTNHQGGTVAFGPDNKLYLSIGDGGGADDDAQNKSGYVHNLPVSINPGKLHNIDCSLKILNLSPTCDAIGNAQDTTRVLGKVLRIDVDARTSLNGQYGIPSDNPYFSASSNGGATACADGFCDEIYAYGFRNPFRFSWDFTSRQLTLGDVGQKAIEEIDVIKPGANYGWHLREGSFCFDPLGFPVDSQSPFAAPQGVVTAVCLGGGMEDPIAQYQQENGGISVLGGYIYRGAISSLKGRYVFADYAKAFNFALSKVTENGRVMYLGADGIKEFGIPVQTCNNATECDKIEPNPALRHYVYFGLGLDSRKEVYVMGNWSGVPGPRVPANTGPLVSSGFIKKIVKK